MEGVLRLRYSIDDVDVDIRTPWVERLLGHPLGSLQAGL